MQGTIRLSNYWGVGKSEYNNGVLLVFSMQDRRMRIAVGDGLTSVLPDDLCQQIIDDTFVPPRNTPPFRAPLLRGKR